MKRLVLSLALLLSTLPTASLAVKPLPKLKELNCLIKNVYHEARGESAEGQVAVATVTLNRVKHPKYPKSICGVVYQKSQFSWTIGYRATKINAKEWMNSVNAAIKSLEYSDLKATHYHNKTVHPNWKLRKVAVIGNHIFYAS